MSKKLPSQAQFWGIRPEEARVLATVTYWYNGKPMKIRGEKRSIDSHQDLPLEDLFRPMP